MAIVFRTDGAWGSGLGVNLSAAQVDNNFYEVRTRLEDLEADAVAGVNDIESITVIGSQMTIFMEDTSTFGPFTIPVAVFHWRGEWATDVDYDELDLVYVVGEGMFLVQYDHTSDSYAFDPGAMNVDSQFLYYKLWGQILGIEDLTDGPGEMLPEFACYDIVVDNVGTTLAYEPRVETVTFFRADTYTADELVYKWIAWRNFIIPVNDVANQHFAFADDGASSSYAIWLNGLTGVELGSIIWDGTTPFFNFFLDPIEIQPGDTISFIAQTGLDATVVNFGWTMQLWYSSTVTT